MNLEALMQQIEHISAKSRASFEAEIRSVLEGVRQGADALKTLPTREELLQRAIIVATADERIDNDMQTYGRIAVSVDPLQVYLSREPSGRGPTLPKGEYRFVLFVLPKG